MDTLNNPDRSHRFGLRWLQCIVLAATLALAGCSGCQRQEAQESQTSKTAQTAQTQAQEQEQDETAQPAPETAQERVLPEDVAIMEGDVSPSPEADIAYAYLCAIRSIQMEDDMGLLEAMHDLRASDIPPELWLEGGVWLVGRKSPVAASYLETALNLWPDNLSLTLLYTEYLADRDMGNKAIEVMQGFLQRHPDSIEGKMEMALLLVKTKRYADADAIFAALAPQQRTPMVEYYHARALIGMHRQADALAHLQKAVKGMPDFVEALAELAFLHEQMGNMRDARTVYEKLLSLDFAPKEVVLRLISCSLRLNQPERALRYMRQGPDTPQFKMAAVNLFLNARCYLVAEGLLKQMVESGQQMPEIFILLAELAFDQGKSLPQALAWLDKVPPDSSFSPKVTMLRAEMLANSGNDNEALKVLAGARARFPDLVEFADMQIRLLARTKQMGAALETARQAQQQWPKNIELRFLLGSILDEMGDKKGAFTIMEGILKASPDNFQALNYVGYTLAEENRDLERALRLLTKANELSPNQSYIIDSLAWALFKMGRYNEALDHIRRAVALTDKADSAIWEHYGDIALGMGLKDEARKAYTKALESKPANADALRQRLSQL